MRRAGLAASVCLTAACYGVTGEVTPIGGGWNIEKQTMHGSEMSHSALVLRRGNTVVDTYVDHYRFFPPDCVIYDVKANQPFTAVCADRAPIRLPEWIIELREDGPWGGYVSATDAAGKTTERWSRVPLDRVLATAQAQPSFRTLIGFPRKPAVPTFEREYVTVVVAPRPPAPPPIRAEINSLASERFLAPGLCADAAQEHGRARANDDQLAISEVSGGITQVDIHRAGRQFRDYAAAEAYIQATIVKRPLSVLRYRPWPGEDKTQRGVVATVHFKSGSTGRFEAVGTHVCISDSNGDVWWISVAPADLFASR